MAGNRKLEALAAVELFAGCSKRELGAIARLCARVVVDDGFVLTTEGGPGHECFVIAAGDADVTIGGRSVAHVGPGACVGEMSLLDGGERTATVTAMTLMVIYVIGAREFQSLLEVSPSISHKIMISLARRLRDAETDRPH